ncbi:hypothetical protein Micbo1qcDRAFT_200245 [Microdochium bolleyi]|uniref:Uncharacterized protein n=1 Tax=Microdochium bolleyi TaxID=196109 RepID=A0A136JKA2_9PEZI|nr:hypothetical protein Micbo1qcDRAFT_200245 [Microdochium bolleyi]
MDKKKIVHQLDTPYSTAKWPEIAPHDQDAILELLCTLLAPIGEHRAQYGKSSKGKRDKKRKRALEKDGKESTSPSPPSPELMAHVDVGLVAVTRRLQGMTAKSQREDADRVGAVAMADKSSAQRPYSAVFVVRAAQPSILNSHLPQMIAAASKACPSQEPVRLVATLMTFVREHVPFIPLDWLPGAQSGEFQPTKINSVATTIGLRKQITKP